MSGNEQQFSGRYQHTRALQVLEEHSGDESDPLSIWGHAKLKEAEIHALLAIAGHLSEIRRALSQNHRLLARMTDSLPAASHSRGDTGRRT